MRTSRLWLLVALTLLLALAGACGESVTTTTDGASAEAAAVASIRENVPWVEFSDGELISAMLYSCSTGPNGPFLKMFDWMLEWGMTRLDTLTRPAGQDKVEAAVQAIRNVGFGDGDLIAPLGDFEFAVYWASQHLCPETWDLQRKALERAAESK